MEAKGSVDGVDEFCRKDKKDAREQLRFSSTLSTYLTLLGYSLGISDFWRFPFLAYRNGGGAFLIPFVIMTFVCAIPLFFLEYSMGKFSSRGVYKIWDISPIFRGIGICIPFMHLMYLTGTTVFRSWTLQLFFDAFSDPLPWQDCNNPWNTDACRVFAMMSSNDSASDVVTSNRHDINGTLAKIKTPAEEYWNNQLLQRSSGMSDLSPVMWKYIGFVFIVRLIVFLCLWKSIRSIEKVMYISTTLPLLLTVAIFINSLTLPGATDGINYFFYPQFSQLLKPRVWIEASVMSFYTMGFGLGTNIAMGSHAHFKENSLRTAVLIPVIDSFSAIFGGLVCFSVLGNMANAYSVPVQDIIEAGLSTGMIAYITALTSLPLPQVWNVCFLIALLTNGIDGQLMPLELSIQVIGDLFHRVSKGSRIIILAILSLIMCLGAIPTCTGAGGYIFLWVDWYCGSWPGIIIVFVEVTVVCWIYGLDRFSEDTKLMIGREIPAVLRFTLAFISPVIVAVIFFMSVVKYVPPKYGSYVYPVLARIGGWGSVAALLLPVPIKAGIILWQTKGSLLQKLKRNLQPKDNWGPIEETIEEQYKDMKKKYQLRHGRDLFHYNVFGTYPKTSMIYRSVNDNGHELDALEKSTK